MPGMRERGFGRIVNVVSTSVLEPIPVLMLSNAHRASMITAFKTISTRRSRPTASRSTASCRAGSPPTVWPTPAARSTRREAAAATRSRQPARHARGDGGGRGVPVLGPRGLHHGRHARRGRRVAAQHVSVDRSILWRAAAVQAMAVALLSVVLAVTLGKAFFEDWGWLAGPGAWIVCSLVTARVLSLPLARTVLGAALAGTPGGRRGADRRALARHGARDRALRSVVRAGTASTPKGIEPLLRA